MSEEEAYPIGPCHIIPGFHHFGDSALMPCGLLGQNHSAKWMRRRIAGSDLAEVDVGLVPWPGVLSPHRSQAPPAGSPSKDSAGPPWAGRVQCHSSRSLVRDHGSARGGCRGSSAGRRCRSRHAFAFLGCLARGSWRCRGRTLLSCSRSEGDRPLGQ